MEKRIKSFVIRQRITKAQTRALSTLSGQYVVSLLQLTKLDELYKNKNPLVIEIGFGMGDATWAIAQSNPSINYLAVEVHTAGIGALLLQIEKYELSNIKIINADAVDILQKLNALKTPNKIAAFHIFCPDPWPKKRHHKRRLLQKEFILQLVTHLKSGGYIHITTDYADYKDFIASSINQADLEYQIQHNQPYNNRPTTKFENRAKVKSENNGDIWDIVIFA